MRVRPWEGPADTAAMQRLASRLWPRGSHAGGLGWEAASGQLPSEIVLAGDDSLAGWAGLTAGELVLQADPAGPEAARVLVEWAVQLADGAEMTVTVFDGDEVVRSAVTAAGFARRAGAMPVVGMFRDASPAGAVLAAGYRGHVYLRRIP